jgi:hypothetical protein
MPIGIHEIGLTGTCRSCQRGIELRGQLDGGLGPRWDDGWRTHPRSGEEADDTRLCLKRMEVARARFRPPTGCEHQPHRANIQMRSAHDDAAPAPGHVRLTRYAVMQKIPVLPFCPAGLLITGVPAGVRAFEVQAEIEGARHGWALWGAVGAFVADVDIGLRHEIVAETEPNFAEIREDRVLAIDWERLVAAAQGRPTLIRHDWQDLRTGGLPGLARKARAHRKVRADRTRRAQLLQ